MGVRRPGPDAQPRRRALRRLVAPGAAVVIGALVLAGCSNAGDALARQACTHVAKSLTSYTRALHTSTVDAANALVMAATRQLEAALPLAAAANSDDPQWNPLMTTLQESGRIAEGNLVGALRSQCAATTHPSQGPTLPHTASTAPTTTTRPSR